MKLVLIFLLVSSTGCDYNLDGRCDSYTMSAFLDVESDIRKEYGDVTDVVLENLELTCSHFIKPMSDRWFQIGGIANWPNDIIIRIYPTLRMTAYVHEIIHLIKWVETGDGDADHSNGDGPWTEEDDAFVLSVWGI